MTERALNLLLVEDDVGIGRMLERGLTAAGYSVDWVRDLAAAVGAARTHSHQLVVLDRMLPDGDGADFCAALRKFGHPAAVCMLTARETLDDKLQGFDAGAYDYMTKPFEFDELLARLTVLGRRAAERKPDLTLDEASRSLVLGAAREKLTKREWPLIKLLMAREGQTVTRDALIADAWELAGDVTDNSVDVYVGYLRKKLAAIEAPVRIETVRGEGFRLVR